MGAPPDARDPAQVREAAERILAEARYDRPPEPIVDRVLGWFGDRIGDALGSLVAGGGGAVVAWVVVLGAVVGVVYLIARHGRVGSLPVLRAERPATMVELSRTARQWREEAAVLEAAGRWREGLRCRHRALVADLVRAGAIPEQAGRTAREYLRDVERTRSPAAEPMRVATDLFEGAWYGGAETGAPESARFAALDDEILAARTS
jgi:hypothetical protein